MLRSVLLPTDLANGSDLVLAFAAGLPKLGVERVVLANVVDDAGLEGPVIDAEVAERRGKLRGAGEQLSDVGLAVETRVTAGEPKESLMALARETGVDGIVCGTHARGVVDQLFLGSVSDRVLREGDIPRLVVRFDLLSNSAEPGTICASFASKLLVPTDFSATSTRAFLAALELPSQAIGTVFVMHALDPALAGDERRQAEEDAESQLRTLCDKAAERGISAHPVVGFAEPVHAILAEVEARRITGIVIGTRGRSPLQEALLGSVSMALVRQASCPLMVMS